MVLAESHHKEEVVVSRDSVRDAFERDSKIIGRTVLEHFGDDETLTRSELEERLVDEGQLFQEAALGVLDEYHSRKSGK